jgi:uncharacterized protein (TIGR02271 family)
MTQVVVGVFDNAAKAAQARHELVSAGFSESEVTVKSQDTGSTGTSTGTGHDREEGGIGGFFRSLFGMDRDDEYTGAYSEAVRRNHSVVTVDAADAAGVDRAEDILDRCGAIDIDERTEQWRKDGWTPPPMQASSSGAMPEARHTEAERNRVAQTDTKGRKIPVIEEELKVGKREVRRGGVRVFSRVSERPVEESVQLREEHARVTRRPVDRPATEADMAGFKEASVEVRETAEEAVVAKRARVVEEVEVGKEVNQREEKVRDTVRRTDVEVEQLDAAADEDWDTDFRSHWQSNFASAGEGYEDYAPAYHYGTTLANSGQYTGRTWDEIEPEVREDWETRNPGSAWERFKASVRYGWEKITGDEAGAARAAQAKNRARPGKRV